MSKCLYCYKEIVDDNLNYHPSCAYKLFGRRKAPILEYTRDNIESLALKVLENNTALTGVQPKLSLEINRGGKNEPDKMTIVGLWGNYILKPQSNVYRSMPENEDLTMKLAEASGIRTVNHGLIRMGDGEIAYITKRADRGEHGEKYSMLDMCQLTNRLTEHKYMGTYKQIAETIKIHSSASMLDVQKFWEIIIFSWITGNSDMHCKNFSLISKDNLSYQLAPAYDLLAVVLTGINDPDELAMPLDASGVKSDTISGLDRSSFSGAMTASGISPRIAERIIDKMMSHKEKWFEIIGTSFLDADLQAQYKDLIVRRLSKLSAR